MMFNARLFLVALASLTPIVLANEHSQCYCTVDDYSNKCVTEQACAIYKNNGFEIFESYNPTTVNITMLWHICATINLNKDGKQAYVSGFGGNEFKTACIQGAGACSDASGKSIGSECD